MVGKRQLLLQARRNFRTLRWIKFGFLFLLLVSPVGGQSGWKPSAYRNPMLWEHFRREYYMTHINDAVYVYLAYPPALSRHERNLSEEYAGCRVRYLLDTVEKRLATMRLNLGQLLCVKQGLIEVGSEPRGRPTTAGLRRVLESIADNAGDLHGRLRFVLPGFKTKSDRRQRPKTEVQVSFQQEIERLGLEILRVDREVRELLSGKATVPVANLADMNPLVGLDRVRELSRSLAKRM